MKTYFPTAEEARADIKWHIVDAEGMRVGRIASEVARLIRGKHKVTYTPHNDCGDGVVIINADKVVFSGNKLQNKLYRKHTLFIGGLKTVTAEELMTKHPTRAILYAIEGMLPKTKLGRKMAKRVKVYAGTEHEQSAQVPTLFTPQYC